MLNFILLSKRAFFIAKFEGWGSVARKTRIYLTTKLAAFVASSLYQPNSLNYWNFRFKWDWDIAGGGGQTQIFATSLFANTNAKDLVQINSILDFGCATGDSAIIFHLFFPKAKIFLYDLSPSALQKGLNKYARFLPVEKWDNNNKVNLAYCSNVIEHVTNPRELLESLISASDNYIIIQCPWKETHQDGKPISPQNPTAEHVWTIDEAFFDKHLNDTRITWNLITGVVPMAWEGGVQAFFVGKLNQGTN